MSFIIRKSFGDPKRPQGPAPKTFSENKTLQAFKLNYTYSNRMCACAEACKDPRPQNPFKFLWCPCSANPKPHTQSPKLKQPWSQPKDTQTLFYSVLWRGTLWHPVTFRTFLLKSCSVSHIQALKKHKKTNIFMQISCDAIEVNVSTNLKTDSSHLNKCNLI